MLQDLKVRKHGILFSSDEAAEKAWAESCEKKQPFAPVS